MKRREFLMSAAAGAGAFFAAPALAELSDPTKPALRRSRINVKSSLEDNLINEFLQPKQITLNVGAQKPFSAIHFSDTHLSMMDAADILSGKTSRDLRLYEARNHGAFGDGGFPFSVQSLAATLAYARKKNVPALNTGDLFDFRSEANISCVARSLKCADVFSALGNHEGHGLHSPGANPQTAPAEDALRGRYEEAYGNPLIVASRVMNGVNFVAFDNCEMARFRRAEQLKMLMAEFAKGLPTVLMCHMPPFSPELHKVKCDRMRSRKWSLPDRRRLNLYYMMGESFEDTKADPAMVKVVSFLRGCRNLKAILCGHLHLEWQGTFGDGVPVLIAGCNFNGECYEVSFV